MAPPKRSFHGVTGSQPDAKKLATQDPAMAASQINAKLGITSTTPAAVPAVPTAFSSESSLLGFGVPQTDNITVPDRMVGFLISKGGEQIAAIQSETQCIVQFATDSGGMPDRVCTLTGTPSAIEKAKDIISRLVTKFRGGGGSTTESDEGSGMIQLLVPGGKVGLIIGKGRETIKQLMESTGTKIVVIQDSNAPSHNDKPVHITGDRLSCQRAKEKIMDLLADKDIQSFGTSSGGRGFKITQEIPIPRTLIGGIIGKGGEMIKKSEEESGSRVQFKPEDDAGGPMRICTITGNEEGNSLASGMIRDLIENRMQRQNDMGGGRGRDGGQGEGGYGGDWSGQGGPGATNYGVPAEKCGLVIGKGGETIREINRISGAHVEMDRNSNQNPHERIFRVQGNPDQVQATIRMINEKAGIQQGGSSDGSQDGRGYQGGPMGGGSMGGGGLMGGGPMGGGPVNSGHGGPMMGPYGQTEEKVEPTPKEMQHTVTNVDRDFLEICAGVEQNMVDKAHMLFDEFNEAAENRILFQQFKAATCKQMLNSRPVVHVTKKTKHKESDDNCPFKNQDFETVPKQEIEGLKENLLNVDKASVALSLYKPPPHMARLEETRSVKENVFETSRNADLMISKLGNFNENGSTPTQSPVEDRLKDVAALSKTPATDRFSAPSPPSALILPTSYQMLLNCFRSCDVVIRMLMNRQEICTFNKLKSAVKKMTKLKFGLKQVGQIKSVFPLAYHIRQEKGRAGFRQGKTVGYQMTFEANLDDVEERNVKNLSPRKSPLKKFAFTAGKLSERKSIFQQNLLEVVKRFHKEFLNKHQIKLNVGDDKLMRWHPKFNLDKVPEVEQAELPLPPDSKFLTAKEMLEEANDKMNTKVHSALETVAKKEKQIKSDIRNVASPVQLKSPGSKPCSPSTSALKGLSPSLLERIRAKEAQKIEALMTRTTADQKRLEMLERLPKLSRILRTYFVTQKRPAIPYQDAVKCLVDSYKSAMGSVEVDRHLKLMVEVLPEWLEVIHVSKGAFLKLDVDIEMTVMIEKLNKLVRNG